MADEREPALDRSDLEDDPIQQFRRWFVAARERSGLEYPNAMCLSTTGPEGMPQGRIVLMKDFDDRGFVFYSNLRSAKGREIDSDPRGALTFHWEALARQVRIAGPIERVEEAEADAYFATRPRGSQIGAWASEQSAPLASREELEARVQEVEERYAGAEVPRPPHWSGLRVVPVAVEFWQGRPSRLHDRFRYERRADGGWSVTRLSP